MHLLLKSGFPSTEKYGGQEFRTQLICMLLALLNGVPKCSSFIGLWALDDAGEKTLKSTCSWL